MCMTRMLTLKTLRRFSLFFKRKLRKTGFQKSVARDIEDHFGNLMFKRIKA